MAFKDNVGVTEELKVEMVECSCSMTREEFIERLMRLEDEAFVRFLERALPLLNK